MLHIGQSPLDVIFRPKSVAVIGATEREGSVGRTVFWNLISTPFGGAVYPINPKRSNVLGVRAYPSLDALPEAPELAVVVTPAPSAPAIMDECVAAGVKGAIIISAGFKEAGPHGVELERQVLERARRGKIRLIGPNCLGVMCPVSGLNATFASAMAQKGTVGFVSQSGALCTAILDWSFRESVGFSAFVSIGSMLDIDWGDLIYYLGDDPNTQSIVIYMESIGNARSFLSAAREVALTKPIIVIKAGRTDEAAKAAASHTGALAGSDAVMDAAFRRCGVLRVPYIAGLFQMAEVLAKQPRPKGPKLTILTNAGGPGVLATDSFITEGGELTDLSEDTMTALNELLPPHWSHNNPIDILGDADADRYAKALDIAARDKNSDGLLVILTPQGMTHPTAIARQLEKYAKTYDKPILASWMGGTETAEGSDLLSRAGIPCFSYPDTAARLFQHMWRYEYRLRGLYETPSFAEASIEYAKQRKDVERLVAEARDAGRTILTELESKQILAAYGIPTVETRHASSADEAVKHAVEIGYPVVLKLHSMTITHKTDVGGVQLNLSSASAVKDAFDAIRNGVETKCGAGHFNGVTVQPMVKLDGYELILGSSPDPQFGPVLLFGSGGQLVEVYKDSALALPPLNTTLARRTMERTRIYKALHGVRGRAPVDIEDLEQLFVRFSQLVVEQRWIKEIDINPLLASEERIIALDARVILHGADTRKEDLPRPAIRPYPRQYVTSLQLKDGTPISIRPIRPEDEPLMVAFHSTLSPRSVYQRYSENIELSKRITHERLVRMCHIDYDRELALVAEHRDDKTGDIRIIAVARMKKLHANNAALLHVVVSDEFQQHGVGIKLTEQLIQAARNEGLDLLMAEVLQENDGIVRLCKKLGFELRRENSSLLAVYDFRNPGPASA